MVTVFVVVTATLIVIVLSTLRWLLLVMHIMLSLILRAAIVPLVVAVMIVAGIM